MYGAATDKRIPSKKDCRAQVWKPTDTVSASQAPSYPTAPRSRAITTQARRELSTKQLATTTLTSHDLLVLGILSRAYE